VDAQFIAEYLSNASDATVLFEGMPIAQSIDNLEIDDLVLVRYEDKVAVGIVDSILDTADTDKVVKVLFYPYSFFPDSRTLFSLSALTLYRDKSSEEAKQYRKLKDTKII
jgi:hypothetical protein